MLLSMETRHLDAVGTPEVEEMVRGDPGPLSLASCEENECFCCPGAVLLCCLHTHTGCVWEKWISPGLIAAEYFDSYFGEHLQMKGTGVFGTENFVDFVPYVAV